MRRIGATGRSKAPCPWAGGPGEISADVRVFWPPTATKEQVLEQLRQANEKTIDHVRSKFP